MRWAKKLRASLGPLAGLACVCGLLAGWRAIAQWRSIFAEPGHALRLDIAPGVVGIWTGASYAYVLTTQGRPEVALVDAGSDPQARALAQELHAAGRSAADVDHIFLTHGHRDHVAGLARFGGAQVHAHMDDAALVWGDEAPRRETMRLYLRLYGRAQLTPSVQPLLPGQTLVHGGHTLEVVGLAGHTRGSVGFATAGGLVAGDAVWSPGAGASRIASGAAGLGCTQVLPAAYNEDARAARRSGCRAGAGGCIDPGAAGAALDHLGRARWLWLADGHGGVVTCARSGHPDRSPPPQAAPPGP